MEQKEMKNDSKNKKQFILYSIIIILLLAIISLAIYMLKPKEVEKNRLQKDLDALAGVLPGKSPKEIQDALNQVVQEGMVNISINPDPTFENGKAEGNISIENIKGNHYALQVDVILNTGEVVYSSGIIDPGYYIEKCKLKKNLPKGDYPATASFTAYYLDNYEDVLAKVNAEITLHILN